MVSTSPTSTVSCSRLETSPSGSAAAADALDRELAVLAVVGAGEAVLAGLAYPVWHRHPHRDVLAGQRVFTSLSSIRLTTNVTTSSVSRIFLSTCQSRHTVSGRTPRAL